MNDYYEILGIKRFATEQEIKKAYRILAKRWHPDANKGDKYSEEKFKLMNEAYYVLSKMDLRADYDFRLRNYVDAINKAAKSYGTNQKFESNMNEELEQLNSFMRNVRVIVEKAIFEEEDEVKQQKANGPVKKYYHKRSFNKFISKLRDLVFEQDEE